MAEVEAGEQGHVADDQPQRGVGDVQAGEPEVDHVAEFAAIVLTCKGRGEAEHGRAELCPAGLGRSRSSTASLPRARARHPSPACSPLPCGSSLLGLSVGGVSKSRI